MSNKPPTIKIDELPDRLAHLRNIAERIKLDQPESVADDPSRNAEVPEMRLPLNRTYRNRIGSRAARLGGVSIKNARETYRWMWRFTLPRKNAFRISSIQSYR